MNIQKSFFKTAYFSFTLLLSILLNSQAPAQIKPPEKKILENGLTLIYRKDESSSITVLQMLIKGGKRDDKGKYGLSYLTTRLLIEIPDQRKAQELMSQASRVYTSAENDYSLITMICISKNFEKTVEILFKLVKNPLFSGMRIDAVKEMMEHHRASQEDSPLSVAHNAHLGMLFTGTDYEGAIIGNEKTLKGIGKKDIEDYYRTHFRTSNLIITVVSDREEEEISLPVIKGIQEFPKGPPLEQTPINLCLPKEREKKIPKDTKQVLISFGYALPGVTSRNYVSSYLLETLIGKGLNSRLWPLRSVDKLAYNVDCRTFQWKEAGILEAYLETDVSKIRRATEALKRALLKVFEDKIEEEEFEITKNYAKSLFLRDTEGKEALASILSKFEALGLGCEFISTFLDELNSINVEDFNFYKNKVLDPEKSVLVFVGPAEEEMT